MASPSNNRVSIDQASNGTTNKVATTLVDELGVVYGIKHIDNKPRVSTMPYLFDIVEGNVSDHTAFAKLGYKGE